MQDMDDRFIPIKDNDPVYDHGLTDVPHGDSHEDKQIKNYNISIEVACVNYVNNVSMYYFSLFN